MAERARSRSAGRRADSDALAVAEEAAAREAAQEAAAAGGGDDGPTPSGEAVESGERTAAGSYDLTVRRLTVQRVDARDVSVSQGAVGLAQAERVMVELGALGGAVAGEVRVTQALANAVVGREVRVDQSLVRTLLANDVRFERPSGVAFLVARRVEGDVRALFDWRAAIAFGAALGLVTALLRRR